ncbi:MAG: hypothetical protein ACLSA6_08705 [Holdemania massiliensis]
MLAGLAVDSGKTGRKRWQGCSWITVLSRRPARRRQTGLPSLAAGCGDAAVTTIQKDNHSEKGAY